MSSFDAATSPGNFGCLSFPSDTRSAVDTGEGEGDGADDESADGEAASGNIDVNVDVGVGVGVDVGVGVEGADVSTEAFAGF